MDSDTTQHRRQGGFPTDQPMEALRKDHDFVKQLFDRYLNTQDSAVRKEAGPAILQLLEMHTALEETVFYPRVHSIDASLVDQCEEEHDEARQMIEQLKGMDASDPQCEQTFRQLADAIRSHIDVEERQLFPKIRQANLDLNALGLEMQAFESNMASAQARASEQSRPAR